MFTLEAPVIGGVNTIAFAVSNTADALYDSALFLSGMTAIAEIGSGGGGIVTPAPIPLPAGGLLLLAGLGALGLRGRRR